MNDDSLTAHIIRKLRMPRAVAGFASGALLSVAGTLLQALLRNPLADPYLLGVSGGAAVFALAAMLFALPNGWIPFAALTGAVIATLLVIGMAYGAFGKNRLYQPTGTTSRLLLTGATLATGWGALLILMLNSAPDQVLRGMVFWLAGDLSGTTYMTHSLPAVAGLLITLAASLALAPRLNVLLHGDTVATTLGIAVRSLRLRLYLIASFATAVAIMTAGTIGFVGLTAPHLMRLFCGNDQRTLLPAAALAGGILVMAADLAARTLVAPTQWPVGAMTALAGIPLFLWMLLKPRSQACHDL